MKLRDLLDLDLTVVGQLGLAYLIGYAAVSLAGVVFMVLWIRRMKREDEAFRDRIFGRRK